MINSGGAVREGPGVRTRQRAVGAVAAFVVASATGCATSGEQGGSGADQGYPQKTITLVVPYAAGGLSDLVGRTWTSKAGPLLGQDVVIVNKKGGGGSVGFASVVSATHDGYTLALGSVGVSAIVPHINKVSYKSPSDYQPIARAGFTPVAIAVRPDSRWQDISGFLEYAKNHPGKINIGIPGEGTIQDMLVKALQAKGDVKFTSVPFAGGAEVIPALLGGHVDAIVITLPPLTDLITSNKVKVLATFAKDRVDTLPDVPTISEEGIDVARDEYIFIIAPSGVSQHVVDKLADSLKKAADDPEFQQFGKSHNFVVDYEGPQELQERLNADYTFYGDLVDQFYAK